VTPLEQLQARLNPLKTALLNHPVYREIDCVESLRVFMEHHVFAVWDFMSLLKALQRRLCCVDVPWLPAADSTATRFINEIVLAEESDEDGQGGFVSHFELYLWAMSRCGADTTAIDRFLAELRLGRSVTAALDSDLRLEFFMFLAIDLNGTGCHAHGFRRLTLGHATAQHGEVFVAPVFIKLEFRHDGSVERSTMNCGSAHEKTATFFGWRFVFVGVYGLRLLRGRLLPGACLVSCCATCPDARVRPSLMSSRHFISWCLCPTT
jgi:hypothetical protein